MSVEATNYLTTRQLARMWQVSEATIKRWADAGHLRSSRTLGGHRRFAPAEVLRFQNEHGLDVNRLVKRSVVKAAAPEKSVRGGHKKSEKEGAARAAFLEAIAQGHEAEAAATLLKLHLNGVSLATLFDEVVKRAMHRVGELWQCGEMSVADEHFSTRTATRAIESVRDAMRREPANGRLALCCAVEEELHEVAALCAQTILESVGWTVINLGANTPFYALSDAVEKHRPQLVCISSTTNLGLDRAVREYEQFHQAARRIRCRIVLGGEGFNDQAIRQRFPSDFYATTFGQLLDFVRDS
jgi:excisionase family DNA binding protein